MAETSARSKASSPCPAMTDGCARAAGTSVRRAMTDACSRRRTRSGNSVIDVPTSADRDKIRRAFSCEITGGQDRSLELSGQFFDASGQIHRRADAREIQPIAAADISVQDLAQMKRQTKTHDV